jgi:glycosyltransferase involved in cell wall biosynthesis
MRSKQDIQDTMRSLDKVRITNWVDISQLLDRLVEAKSHRVVSGERDYREAFAGGLAFITFGYGIDGVSVEISKYAKCLESILSSSPTPQVRAEDGGSSIVHLIGGDFTEKADAVIAPNWSRFALPNSNGWGKWNGGRWFSRLFYEDMPLGSTASSEMAAEIWRQALGFTHTLCDYVAKNSIELMIPVNVNSNPGNLALALAVVLTTEVTDICVLNSNHDFFWEGGQPRSERAEGEAPGLRDHFFRNYENGPFFTLFERILPWNRPSWLQMNINKRQSETLVAQYGFAENRVCEVGTAVEAAFFSEYTTEEKYAKRKSMAYVLSDGSPVIKPTSVEAHLADLGNWMKKQIPVVCGADEGAEELLDIATPAALYFLQPTRIVGRKRIERNWRLIGALMQYDPFREAFERDPNRTLTLHITGPVPIEHQADVRRVLDVYREVLRSLPGDVARRLFQAFSVGHEDHPALAENGLNRLYIQDIYKLADVVVFPSESEGRGLPIVESSAAGVPIVCSRYRPESVFCEVVGEHLDEELWIHYTLFPEGDFGADMLQEVTDIVFFPERMADRTAHNRTAVARRYSMQALQNTFRGFLDVLTRR